MLHKTGILLIALLGGSFGIPTPENDISKFFYQTDPSARIVGGTPAPDGSVPYMVSLMDGLLLRYFICGGSLVTPRSVLTAAHCIQAVYGRTGLSSSLRGTVGSMRYNYGGTRYSFSRNVTHQHYVHEDIKNDLGLLITTSNVAISATVALVPLSFDEVGGGVRSRVAGWGNIREGGALSSSLLELYLDTIDGRQCVEDVAAAAVAMNFNAPPVDPQIEICTFHSPGHGTCNGDSGSALVEVSTGRQIGIVSWGFPCARGAPDMFVRVSGYRLWFAEHLI